MSDIPKFFRRRVGLDDIKSMLPTFANQVYYDSKSYKQFKYELILTAVDLIIWERYRIDYTDLPEQDEIKFVTYVSEVFGEYIEQLYNQINKNQPPS